MQSLRAKLTVVNVALLALGIVAATAVSLMGMRHYLLESVDSELHGSRNAVQGAGLTRAQIDSISAIGALIEQFQPGRSASTLANRETIMVALDAEGVPVTFAGIAPTGQQRELAASIRDPAGLSRAEEVAEFSIGGDPYRGVAAQLGDGTHILMAANTEAVHDGVRKALKLDLTFGTLLLALLALLTMLGARHRLRPLEDMVETASAIAEGDLTRRVPAGRNPVSEIEQLRVALNSMLHQVESAFETREHSAAQLRRFVADASHELRTPLSAIRGYLQLYDKGMLREPAERTRALTRMMGEADRMGRLVEELLTLARLDQHPRLRVSGVDLSSLVRDAADDLRAQQPRRPLAVRADGAMVIQGDESGLRQIVGNLLANVRVHTPADVPVRVELARENSDGHGPGGIRLLVADDGPGMSDEDAERIFDRFFRAGGGSPAGSGLGMAIVQAVVTSHGGSVRVETAPEKGLAVTVTFPAAAGARVESSAAGP